MKKIQNITIANTPINYKKNAERFYAERNNRKLKNTYIPLWKTCLKLSAIATRKRLQMNIFALHYISRLVAYSIKLIFITSFSSK